MVLTFLSRREIESVGKQCEPCIYGKAKEKLKKQLPDELPHEQFSIDYYNWGLKSSNNHQYSLTVIDGRTWWVEIRCFASRDSPGPRAKRILTWFKKQLKREPLELRMDNEHAKSKICRFVLFGFLKNYSLVYCKIVPKKLRRYKN